VFRVLRFGSVDPLPDRDRFVLVGGTADEGLYALCNDGYEGLTLAETQII